MRIFREFRVCFHPLNRSTHSQCNVRWRTCAKQSLQSERDRGMPSSTCESTRTWTQRSFHKSAKCLFGCHQVNGLTQSLRNIWGREECSGLCDAGCSTQYKYI